MTTSTAHLATIALLTAANVAHPGCQMSGTLRGPVRLFLHTYAGGKCAVCGITTRLDAQSDDDDRAEISHVASVGDSKRGIRPGAVFNGCRSCNLAAGETDMTDMLHLFYDASLIPTMWDTFPAMRAAYAAHRTPVRTDSADRRAALGLPF